jgi:tetratricopeptide (TPR) repeat protein
MRTYIIALIIVLCTINTVAQVPYNAALPNGYSKKAVVSEQVGLTQVSITYHRPAVNGREGKIWGGVVHAGFVDQGFGNRNPAPWRAGANENTIIEFDHDVKIENQSLAKGKYGFFIAYGDECTLIFSTKNDAWGSFFYDDKEDALRVKVKPRPVQNSVEFLKYDFESQTINSAIITLTWEKLAIPFKVEVDYLKQQFEAFVKESQNPAGFTSEGLNAAANWALQNNYQLDKALDWATLASSSNFPGNPSSFPALLTKATILNKLGKTEDANKTIRSAIPFGNINQLQQLGRQLITEKKQQLANEVFEANYKKNPDQFITLVGMARGASAIGDSKKALEYANKALPLAPNEAGKEAVKGMIEKLNAGKEIN